MKRKEEFDNAMAVISQSMRDDLSDYCILLPIIKRATDSNCVEEGADTEQIENAVDSVVAGIFDQISQIISSFLAAMKHRASRKVGEHLLAFHAILTVKIMRIMRDHFH